MKNLYYFTFHLFIFTSKDPDGGIARDTISIYELKKISSPIIIDIRDNYSYSISHVKNAINIPYYNLLNNYSHYLNKNKRYYLYCEEGKQSLEISKRLNAFGYDTLSITGGFISFK